MAAKKTKKKTKKKRKTKKKATRRAAVPPPISGIARSSVGKTVQRFIHWDDVRKMAVIADDPQGTTYTVTPRA